MKIPGLRMAVAMSFLFSLMFAARAEVTVRHAMPNRVANFTAKLSPLADVAGTNHLDLVLALSWQNPQGLTNLLKQLTDPASTNYHHWLSPDDFARQFGPTTNDYQKILDFATAHGLKVTRTHANRMMVDVTGPVANIEGAFQVKLHVYRHPTENRNFYAPDSAPSVETNVPMLCVSGLDNYELPYRLGGAIEPVTLTTNSGIVAYATGSGPSGNFTGGDFRAAYVPGVTNTGAGQYIAIVDVGGAYYTNDIYKYETNAGLHTVVSNILLSGSSGIPVGTNQDDGEETLDIDMAMSMAPDAVILNYEGEAHDVFNQIAIDGKAKQLTLSYGFGIDDSLLQTFQELEAQGQSFSQASGDGGADENGGTGLTGNPYATIVGGSDLTTTGPQGAWVSETAWVGSGGGISGYGIPDWQEGVATTSNQGSSTNRNYPDVAMLADTDIWWYLKNGQGGAVGGTSAASPLWAGFMALVNQQAAAEGNQPAGFVNPAIYGLGKGSYSAYTNCFHDLTAGNTTNAKNPTRYYAGVGYDLCTGWGTPTGSNTINYLAGIGTNDFTFYAAQPKLTLVAGGQATTAIQMAPMNRFSGRVGYSVSNLPPGVTAVFGTAGTSNTSTLTLSLTNVEVPNNYVVTLTGTSGSLVHTSALYVAITVTVPGATQASLSSYYNRAGIYTDGRAFSGGLDNDGSAYPASFVGSALYWNGAEFKLGPANALDAVSCSGQTIPLPAGNYSTVLMLGAAVNGSQNNQNFVTTYTDGTTTTNSLSLSDWAGPQNLPSESTIVAMPYRTTGGGTPDVGTAVNVYGYSLVLDQTRTVSSITLPNDNNIEILAMAVANTGVSATLSPFYNRAGMYTDGTTFTNPATGGLDGGGEAYSASLLGNYQIWNGVQLNFGPANKTNAVSAAGQTIPLPAGNYWAIEMLGTGVQGAQNNQQFVVTYTDNSTTTFSQTLSDWFTPIANNPNETKVFPGYRNNSNGTQDNRTFYVYGYTFRLNSAKVVKSIRLPVNQYVEVLSMSLIPDWAPQFYTTPFSGVSIMAGQNYSGTVATNATDLNGDAITFAKVSGPSWLTVSANGTLSGEPLSANAGTNTFVISATDPGGLSSQATLNIVVASAPPVVSGLSFQNGVLQLNWSGGVSPYQVQMTTNLADPNWQNVGSPMTGGTLSVTPTNAQTFYRIIGQ